MTARESLAEISPVFVGYFPKRTATRPDWLKNLSIVEIGSASNCISPGPADWIRHWLHNEHGFYDSVSAAESMIPKTESGYEIYGYGLYQAKMHKGQLGVNPITSSAEAPPAEFALLGYDIVSKSQSDFFECSPLSCNGLSNEVPVNRYCLIDAESDAFNLYCELEKKHPGCEPGPYFLVKVYRRVRDA